MTNNSHRSEKPKTSHHPETDPKRKDKNYYGIPPIKRAHWTWQIYVYFFVGGVGAGSHLLATLGHLLGWRDEAFFRATKYTTLVAMVVSPVLLVWDLGRPERFFNMLRILKFRSPMSTGSWALSVFGGLSGLVATKRAAEDGLLLGDNPLSRLAKLVPERLVSVLALPFALYVGAYTGILLIATSVPMWARNWRLMGPTFLSSAVSSGLSWTSLVLHLGNWGESRTLGALKRAERLVLVIEAALIAASLFKMGKWSKPLFSKRLGPLFVGGTLLGGIAAPLALLSGEESRRRSILASLLVLVGGFLFRYVMVVGGRDSADDPQAYFSFARRPETFGTESSGSENSETDAGESG